MRYQVRIGSEYCVPMGSSRSSSYSLCTIEWDVQAMTYSDFPPVPPGLPYHSRCAPEKLRWVTYVTNTCSGKWAVITDRIRKIEQKLQETDRNLHTSRHDQLGMTTTKHYQESSRSKRRHVTRRPQARAFPSRRIIRADGGLTAVRLLKFRILTLFYTSLGRISSVLKIRHSSSPATCSVFKARAPTLHAVFRSMAKY